MHNHSPLNIYFTSIYKGEFFVEQSFEIYEHMKARTNGEIYFGIVGPVRTGKSTFIKRFMDLFVLPNIENETDRKQALDEMPQSAGGTTVMTTEPKFIPKEAVTIHINEDVSFKVRLVDCVGFMVDGATGHLENEKERNVKTPWFDYDIPFSKAAEIGTQKVIHDHSTVGIVVTTDGSFGSIKREDYEAAEEKTIAELKALHKPFIVILNSLYPYSKETRELEQRLNEKYQVKVISMNCDQLRKEDISRMMEGLLLEFPLLEIQFQLPKWVEMMEENHPLKEAMVRVGMEMVHSMNMMRDVYDYDYGEKEYIQQIKLDHIDLSTGTAYIIIKLDDKYYYELLSQMLDMKIESEFDFIRLLKNLAKNRGEYDKVSDALCDVQIKGYGTVAPTKEQITLDKPEIIRHGNKFGVKIKAVAPSIHFIKANVTTEIAPIVGSEEQAKDLISYMEADSKDNPEAIWDVNIFGKTIEQLVEEGIRTKTSKMKEESQLKLQDTMEKIVYEGNGGLICIII